MNRKTTSKAWHGVLFTAPTEETAIDTSSETAGALQTKNHVTEIETVEGVARTRAMCSERRIAALHVPTSFLCHWWPRRITELTQVLELQTRDRSLSTSHAPDSVDQLRGILCCRWLHEQPTCAWPLLRCVRLLPHFQATQSARNRFNPLEVFQPFSVLAAYSVDFSKRTMIEALVCL